jgi:hypothetical protein
MRLPRVRNGHALATPICSMLAIGVARYQALRGNPAAIKRGILRQALDHLAIMSVLLQEMLSEREVLSEIRVCQRNVDMIDDPTMRRQMVERYVREDALVDAALARGDRERPLTIGTNWKYVNTPPPERRWLQMTARRNVDLDELKH